MRQYSIFYVSYLAGCVRLLDDSPSVLDQRLEIDPLRLSLRFDGADSLEVDMRMEEGTIRYAQYVATSVIFSLPLLYHLLTYGIC